MDRSRLLQRPLAYRRAHPGNRSGRGGRCRLVLAQDRRGGLACVASVLRLDEVSDAWRVVHCRRRRPVRPGGRPLRRPAGGRILQRRHVPPPRVDLRGAEGTVPRLPLLQLRRRARAEAGELRLPRHRNRRRRRSSPSTACASAPTRPARTRPASSPTSATTASGCRIRSPASACSTCAATPAASASTPRCAAREEVVGVDIDEDVLEIAERQRQAQRCQGEVRAGRHLPVAARRRQCRRMLYDVVDPRPGQDDPRPRAGDPGAEEVPRHEQAGAGRGRSRAACSPRSRAPAWSARRNSSTCCAAPPSMPAAPSRS